MRKKIMQRIEDLESQEKRIRRALEIQTSRYWREYYLTEQMHDALVFCSSDKDSFVIRRLEAIRAYEEVRGNKKRSS
jgi:ATP-dependent Lon protease